MNRYKDCILNNEVVLGIELGSTRIKAVLIDKDHTILAFGSSEWENKFENGIWTYSLEDIHKKLQESYANLRQDVKNKYDVELNSVAAIGISAMMHGYMAFDENWNLLTDFRTWRNTITQPASDKLSELFGYNIPQRWSIAHLYQAILNGEEHLKNLSHLTTLAGYIHYLLTGKSVLGVGDASGMFPIDIKTKTYNSVMMQQFDNIAAQKGFNKKIIDIIPEVLCAGETAGHLTLEGARFLDVSGTLHEGALVCPPEGDAGTGMVATNSIDKRTGNVSAGTSAFAMIVLEKELLNNHREIDMVTTPDGNLVAMVHCNNCTGDLNHWVGIFKEFSDSIGSPISYDKLFETLFMKALEGDKNGGGLLCYNYLSGEHIVNIEKGRPLFVRTENSKFNLANFMRVQLYSALCALKKGMDLLHKEENISIDKLFGHGGFFKNAIAGQKIAAAIFNTPISVMECADHGGAWGIAILAAYMKFGKDSYSLPEYLKKRVFNNQKVTTVNPDKSDVEGFNEFFEKYISGMVVEEIATKHII